MNDKELYQGRWAYLSGDSALSVSEQLDRAWYDFTYLIIRWLFMHQVMSYTFVEPRCSACCSRPLTSSIFRPEWISFSSLFCSFWHPTKLIASKGIGVEGLVLFWQFFQEWPSIRWSIVLERDLSLLNSWLAAKSRCYNGIESFQGTL